MSPIFVLGGQPASSSAAAMSKTSVKMLFGEVRMSPPQS
jgi:hypothetical protein